MELLGKAVGILSTAELEIILFSSMCLIFQAVRFEISVSKLTIGFCSSVHLCRIFAESNVMLFVNVVTLLR